MNFEKQDVHLILWLAALSSQAAHDILLKKVHSLPEADINAIRKRVQVKVLAQISSTF